MTFPFQTIDDQAFATLMNDYLLAEQVDVAAKHFYALRQIVIFGYLTDTQFAQLSEAGLQPPLDNPRKFLLQALVFMREGFVNYQLVHNCVRQALMLNSNDPDALYLLVKVDFDVHDPVEDLQSVSILSTLQAEFGLIDSSSLHSTTTLSQNDAIVLMLHKILQLCPNHYLALTTLTDEILYCSPRLQTTLGYSADNQHQQIATQASAQFTAKEVVLLVTLYKRLISLFPGHCYNPETLSCITDLTVPTGLEHLFGHADSKPARDLYLAKRSLAINPRDRAAFRMVIATINQSQFYCQANLADERPTLWWLLAATLSNNAATDFLSEQIRTEVDRLIHSTESLVVPFFHPNYGQQSVLGLLTLVVDNLAIDISLKLKLLSLVRIIDLTHLIDAVQLTALRNTVLRSNQQPLTLASNTTLITSQIHILLNLASERPTLPHFSPNNSICVPYQLHAPRIQLRLALAVGTFVHWQNTSPQLVKPLTQYCLNEIRMLFKESAAYPANLWIFETFLTVLWLAERLLFVGFWHEAIHYLEKSCAKALTINEDWAKDILSDNHELLCSAYKQAVQQAKSGNPSSIETCLSVLVGSYIFAINHNQKTLIPCIIAMYFNLQINGTSIKEFNLQSEFKLLLQNAAEHRLVESARVTPTPIEVKQHLQRCWISFNTARRSQALIKAAAMSKVGALSSSNHNKKRKVAPQLQVTSDEVSALVAQRQQRRGSSSTEEPCASTSSESNHCLRPARR